MYNKLHDNDEPYLTLLDIAKAFHSVHHPSLISALCTRGILHLLSRQMCAQLFFTQWCPSP